MAFKVLVYSFAFKRHCNVWLLEPFAILVKAYQRNIQYASIIRQLFKLCFHMTDLFLHSGQSTSYFGIQNPHRHYILLLTLSNSLDIDHDQMYQIYLSLARIFNK